MKKIFGSILVMSVVLATSIMFLSGCSKEDSDSPTKAKEMTNPLVGSWRLAELKTESWLAYYDGREGKHGFESKTYGKSGGTWEYVYTFKSDGSYVNDYVDDDRVRTLSGSYSYTSGKLTISGETYDVEISDGKMEWSHEAERKEIGSMIQATYIKMEYATWYKL